MRDWLKGLLGGTAPDRNDIPASWVACLRKAISEGSSSHDTRLTDRQVDDAVDYVMRGVTGTYLHPIVPQTTRGIVYSPGREGADADFFAPLETLPPDVVLRAAQVLEALMLARGNHNFHMAFPGGVHWPEILLQLGSGRGFNVYPASTTQTLTCAALERVLVAAGMEPSAVIVAAFATPLDKGWGLGPRLLSVSYASDYPQALERHVEAIRPHLVTTEVAQRVHIIAMLERASPATLDKLAPELAELACSSSKQVRIAADPALRSASDAILPPLKELALRGKPEQRQLALRQLHERGKRRNESALCEFARATAAADKAASVQALTAEWDELRVAEAAPEAKYEIAVPVIDWSAALDDRLAARVDRMWSEMNALIRADNQRAREYYQKYTAQHGQPKWKLHQHDELPSGALKDLKALLDSRKPPTGVGNKQIMTRIWVTLSAVTGFANEAWLLPTQLYKVLHSLGLLFDANARLNRTAIECFNRMYASSGRPNLLELAKMVEDSGQDPSGVLVAYCTAYGVGLAREWRNEDVWPFVAHHVQAVERFLLGLGEVDYSFNREMIYQAISTLPTPPPRLVNALFTVALGPGKSERLQAQEALGNQPHKEARIISALADGKSETRMIAAQWLGRLRHAPAIPALEKAVAGEKHDTAKGAMLDTLQALGQPVEKYLKRDSLLPEARKMLAKGLPKELEWVPWAALPEVRWADSGEAVPAEVLKWMLAQACRAKSAEPNAVLRKYCAMFEARERERFGQWVLDNWLREDVAPIPAEEAQKMAQATASSVFNSMKSHPQYYKDNPLLGKSAAELLAFYLPACLRQPRGSAIGSKGVLAVSAACAADGAAAPVARYIKEWYGTRASQGKALINMLAWIEHPSATQVMLAIGNRFRTRSLQEEATRQAEALAERKGWTLAELADRTIPSAGFDENCELDLSYGHRAFTAKLLPDFRIELYNPEGKKIAALPEPRQDDDADLAKDSKKALSAAKKEIKSIVALQTDRLYEALCTGRKWSFSEWQDYLYRHPVVRHLAQRLVWLHFAAGTVAGSFRPLDDGTLTNLDDEPVSVAPEAEVRLAHDSLLPAGAVARWQQHLVDYEIQPLFQQLGKGTYELPASKQDAKDVLDFKGHLLEAFALRGRANKLGYQRGAAEDGGWFHVYEKRFPTLGLTAVVEFTGNPLPEENRTVGLISLTFSAGQSQNSWERGQVSLKKIPSVLLSECYNDLRLMAAEGTGFDPDWEKKSAY